jgi:hypothetical protein
VRRRLVLVGVAVAVLGAYLTLAPIQTTPLGAPTLGDGQWTDVWVPPLADVLGGSVQVQVGWGAYQPACVGFCPNRYSAPPFRIVVFDCGSSPCHSGSTYPGVGASGYSTFTVVDFSATPGHHYQIWANQALPVGGTMQFQISMVAPLFGGLAGAGFLAVGGLAVAYGVRGAGVPRPAWPAACRP